MKPEIHPDYHEVTLVMPDGAEFPINSTYGKAGDKIHLDVDFRKHPAWTGSGTVLNERAGRVAQFKEKFGAIGSFSAKKPAEAPAAAEKPAEAPAAEAPAAEAPEAAAAAGAEDKQESK